MRTCRGCGAEYSDAEPFCPDCGLGAGAARPDLSTRVPEAVLSEESTDVGSNRTTRTVVTSVIAVLVVITGTLVGVVLARDPESNPGISAVDAEHPTLLPPTIQEPSDTGVLTDGPKSAGTPASSGSSESNLHPDPHSHSATAPGDSGGNGERPLVVVAPALAGRTGVSEVTALLNRYFTAINDKDRSNWESSLIPRDSGLDWEGLQSTTDSQVTLSAVDTTVTPVRASVSFVSHQDPSNGNGYSCTNWSIVYPLTDYSGQLRIDRVNQQIISQQPCSG